MKPTVLQLGGIGDNSPDNSAASPSNFYNISQQNHNQNHPSSVSSAAAAPPSGLERHQQVVQRRLLQHSERQRQNLLFLQQEYTSNTNRHAAATAAAVDLSVLGSKKVDGRSTMTTVVTNNTMSDQVSHPHHPLHPLASHHRNSSSSASNSNSSSANAMSKSITRLLQHSILQLCNEHIGYTHKLQILGVLCMTVDDEQQELVVKVNNTLKRVGPVAGPKDAVHLHGPAAGMPPSVQTLTSPSSSSHGPPPPPPPLHVSPHLPPHHPHHPHTNSNHHPHHSSHNSRDQQGTDLSIPGSSRSSSATRSDDPTSHPASPAPSPLPLNMSGRKSHGRKGSNPTKVQQVVEENPMDTDDDEDVEEAVTVMPEAPENSRQSHSGPPSPASSSNTPQPNTTSSTPSLSAPGRYRAAAGGSGGPSGSAKRKPSHHFRVPQYPSPAGSPYVRPVSAGSPYTLEDGTDAAGASSTGRGAASSSGHGGISLPIYVAGTYSAPHGSDDGGQNDDDQPINLAAGSSAGKPASPSSSRHHNGLMNGRDSSREGSPACSSANGERPGSTSSVQRVKDEPDDDSESEYKEQLTSLEEYARANVAALFSPGDGDRDARMEGLHPMLPYAGIGMYLPRQGFDSPSRLEASDERGDGLTIKYTSTGPYTVGANGKDVSNSSRIKDIIMYDDQSPLSAQKGARIETDYIVDKLGLDGRKRRRRAPEDLLTPEEIAEYLGQPERSDYNFRCKYCSEEFDSITRYIHHTLAAHQAYICHQCGKSFTTKSSLLRHRPIHTGMRRFACSICKKTFYRKDKCKAHIRRHLGLPSGSAVTAEVNASAIDAAAPLMTTDGALNSGGNSQFPSPVEASANDADSP